MKPITVYCPVNGTGYGIAASNMFDTVVQKDMVNLVPYWDNIDPPDGVSESFRNAAAEGIKRRPEYGRSPIAFILCHANLLTAPNQRKVGYTFFELNKFKSEELSVMQSIEAVGTASHWGVQVLGNYLDVPTFRIPCGVDTKFFSPGEPESTIEYPEGTRFVSIGKFEKRKGHETILSVLRNWSGNPIVINAFWNNPFLGPPSTLPNKIIRSGFRFVEEKDAYKVFQSGKARLYLHRSIHGRHYMRDRIRDSQFGLYPSAAEGWDLPLCVVPGRTLLANGNVCPIEEVKVGDTVFTHRSRERKVVNTRKSIYSGNICKIRLFCNHEEIEVTPAHPIYAIKRERFSTKAGRFRLIPQLDPEWVPAKEIQVGDLVIKSGVCQTQHDYITVDLAKIDSSLKYDDYHVWYKTGYNHHGDIKRYRRFVCLRDMAYLLGWYIAEGSTEKHKIDFTLNARTEMQVAKNIIGQFETVFEASGAIKIDGGSIHVLIYSTILQKLFSALCGGRAINKKIPNEILYGPLETLWVVITNATLGDGYRRNCSSKTQYSTSSYILSRQFLIALQRLGIKPRVQAIDPSRKKHGFRSENLQYSVEWHDSNSDHRHSNKSWWHPSGLAFLVRNVSAYEYNGYVYNLEVEEDNSYLMTNATVHNCECMSSGVAPITTDVTAHADFADPCILVDTYKEPAFDGRFFKDPRILWDAVIPDRLKQVLIEATEGRYDYHKIGSNCRKQALQMDWSNTHKQVEAFIRHLENTL